MPKQKHIWFPLIALCAVVFFQPCAAQSDDPPYLPGSAYERVHPWQYYLQSNEALILNTVDESNLHQILRKISVGDDQHLVTIEHYTGHPYGRIGRLVGRLGIMFKFGSGGPTGTYYTNCTATLIGPDKILTNYHCIPGEPSLVTPSGPKMPIEAIEAKFELDYDHSTSGPDETIPVELTPVSFSRNLDYAVLKLSTPPSDVAQRFHDVGTIEISKPATDDSAFIIEHPFSYSKLVASACQITGVTSDGLLTHNCSTYGGASGSPIFAERSDGVSTRYYFVGLHHSGYDERNNEGIQIPAIVSSLSTEDFEGGPFSEAQLQQHSSPATPAASARTIAMKGCSDAPFGTTNSQSQDVIVLIDRARTEFLSCNYDGAIGLYSAALNKPAGWQSEIGQWYFARGWAHFVLKEWQDAADDFASSITQPGQSAAYLDYERIGFFLAKAMDHNSNIGVPEKPGSGYPGVYLRMFRGEITPTAVLAQAPGLYPGLHGQGVGEANFYVGMYYLIHGQADEARSHFEVSWQSDQVVMEAHAARSQLLLLH